VTLPSETGGATTEEVGYFEGASKGLAEWLVVGLDGSWCVRRAGLSSMSVASTASRSDDDILDSVFKPWSGAHECLSRRDPGPGQPSTI